DGVDILFYRGLSRRRTDGPECLQGMQRTCPGAEILGAELFGHGLPYIRIHHTAVDGMTAAILRIILEQLLPGDVMTLADDTGQPLVTQGHVMLYTLLSLKGKNELVSV